MISWFTERQQRKDERQYRTGINRSSSKQQRRIVLIAVRINQVGMSSQMYVCCLVVEGCRTLSHVEPIREIKFIYFCDVHLTVTVTLRKFGSLARKGSQLNTGIVVMPFGRAIVRRHQRE